MLATSNFYTEIAAFTYERIIWNTGGGGGTKAGVKNSVVR